MKKHIPSLSLPLPTKMNQDNNDDVHHSKPIPISTQHLRNRSTSFSSDSTSPASSPPLVTPNNFPNTRFPVSSSSPILYFLSQSSPSKTPATFPFRGLVPPPLLEGAYPAWTSRPVLQHPCPTDEPAEERNPPTSHARRSSIAGRFQPQPSVPELHHERGVNVLRRLSLRAPKVCLLSLFAPFDSSDVWQSPATDISQPDNPQSTPNTAISNTPVSGITRPNRKVHRSATVTERPRRAPSPMGERILRGHFDGFN